MTSQKPPPEEPLLSTAPDALVADKAEADARMAFVFRTTQRQGRIHPLLHLMQQHRAAGAKTKGDAA